MKPEHHNLCVELARIETEIKNFIGLKTKYPPSEEELETLDYFYPIKERFPLWLVISKPEQLKRLTYINSVATNIYFTQTTFCNLNLTYSDLKTKKCKFKNCAFSTCSYPFRDQLYLEYTYLNPGQNIIANLIFNRFIGWHSLSSLLENFKPHVRHGLNLAIESVFRSNLVKPVLDFIVNRPCPPPYEKIVEEATGKPFDEKLISTYMEAHWDDFFVEERERIFNQELKRRKILS